MLAGEVPIYWLLDTVVHHREPIDTLWPDDPDDPDYFRVVFNRESHGLDVDDLVDTLNALFQKGWLSASFVRDPDTLRDDSFVPSYPQVRDALAGAVCTLRPNGESSRLWYGLSEQGGRQWEAFAQPDWDRRILLEEAEGETVASALNPSSFELLAATPSRYVGVPVAPVRGADAPALSGPRRRHVRLSSTSASALDEFLDRDLSVCRIADPATVRRQRIRHWKPAYWKTFPVAHQLEYSLWSEENLAANEAIVSDYEALDLVTCRNTPTWYTSFLTGQPSR
jgi:hypothetical protein